MIDIRPIGAGDVKEIVPGRFQDDRGYFSESWSWQAFADVGLDFDFVQDNHSYNARAGVLRGLHYQLPPAAQDKLIRVTRGSALDVAVDIRRDSSRFGVWVGVVLSAHAGNQVLIPRGFAHGFVTLEDDTEVQYNVTALYRPDRERCIRFDDPAIGIDWQVPVAELLMSQVDRDARLLAQADLPDAWS